MRKTLLLASLVATLLWGCTGSPDINAPVTTKEKPAPIQDQAMQALLPRLSEIARANQGDWASLSQDLKQPFLDFHGGDAEKAEKHYVELVRLELEEPSQIQ